MRPISVYLLRLSTKKPTTIFRQESSTERLLRQLPKCTMDMVTSPYHWLTTITRSFNPAIPEAFRLEAFCGLFVCFLITIISAGLILFVSRNVFDYPFYSVRHLGIFRLLLIPLTALVVWDLEIHCVQIHRYKQGPHFLRCLLISEIAYLHSVTNNYPLRAVIAHITGKGYGSLTIHVRE